MRWLNTRRLTRFFAPRVDSTPATKHQVTGVMVLEDRNTPGETFDAVISKIVAQSQFRPPVVPTLPASQSSIAFDSSVPRQTSAEISFTPNTGYAGSASPATGVSFPVLEQLHWPELPTAELTSIPSAQLSAFAFSSVLSDTSAPNTPSLPTFPGNVPASTGLLPEPVSAQMTTASAVTSPPTPTTVPVTPPPTSNPSVTVLANTPPTLVEGKPTDVVLAKVAYPVGSVLVGTVLWGDGSRVSPVRIVDDPTLQVASGWKGARVQGSTAYATTGNYTANLTLRGSAVSVTTIPVQVTVTPETWSLSAIPGRAVEGRLTQEPVARILHSNAWKTSGGLTGATATLTVLTQTTTQTTTIEGPPASPPPPGGSTTPVAAVIDNNGYVRPTTGLTFATPGRQTVQMSVTDAQGVTKTSTTTVDVEDAPLHLQAASLPDTRVFDRQLLGTLTDENPNGVATDLKVFVDWGDGQAETLAELVPISGSATRSWQIRGSHVLSGDSAGLIRIRAVSSGNAATTLSMPSGPGYPGPMPFPSPPPPFTGSISGYVYIDTNGNGQRDQSDEPLPGLHVMALTGAPIGPVDDYTDASGYYEVPVGKAGPYFLEVTDWYSHYKTGAITVGTAGGISNYDWPVPIPGAPIIWDIPMYSTPAISTGNNFELIRIPPNGPPITPPPPPPASDNAEVRGFVYEDVNNNGSRQSSEPGIAGTWVQLYREENGQTLYIGGQTTPASGAYAFTGLKSGTYRVVESQPGNFVDGPEQVGTTGGSLFTNDTIASIPLATSQISENNNFAEYQPGELSGFVYDDVDNSGTMDSGEAGLAGVTITLSGTSGGQSITARVLTTASDGSYRFDMLAPGTYTVTETQPANATDGKEKAGTTGGSISVNDVISAIPLTYAGKSERNLFGDLATNRLSGSVYVDANNNAARDTAETGISGVLVRLERWFSGAYTSQAVALTDAKGNYSFAGLPGGQYQVTEVQPSDYLDGSETIGNAGGSIVADDKMAGIVLNTTSATGYLFGERPGQFDLSSDDAYLWPIGHAQVELYGGNLRVGTELDFDLSPGTSVGRNPALLYNSGTVAVKPIIPVNYRPGFVPSTLRARLTWNGGTAQSWVNFSTTGATTDSEFVLAVAKDSAVTASGAYGFQVEVEAIPVGSTTPQTTTINGIVPVVARDTSPYGAGWGLAGVDQLVPVAATAQVPAGQLWISGDGNGRFFALKQNSTTEYTSPVGDTGTLVKLSNGTWSYTAKDQRQKLLDTSGRLSRVIETTLVETDYFYNSTGLSSVVASDGGTTTLNYTSGKLSSIVQLGAARLRLRSMRADNSNRSPTVT